MDRVIWSSRSVKQKSGGLGQAENFQRISGDHGSWALDLFYVREKGSGGGTPRRKHLLQMSEGGSIISFSHEAPSGK